MKRFIALSLALCLALFTGILIVPAGAQDSVYENNNVIMSAEAETPVNPDEPLDPDEPIAMFPYGNILFLIHRQAVGSTVCKVDIRYTGSQTVSSIKFSRLQFGTNILNLEKYGAISGRTIPFSPPTTNGYVYAGTINVPTNITTVNVRYVSFQAYSLSTGIWSPASTSGCQVSIT